MLVLDGQNIGGISTFNGARPDQGTKVIPLILPFTNSLTTIMFDGQKMQELDKLTGVQSVYIDNSANADPVTLVFEQTQHSITCPPTCQGYFPCLVPTTPRFKATTNGAVIVTVTLINAPMPAAVWSLTSPITGAIPVTITGSIVSELGGTSGVDHSGSIPALLTIQQTIAPNVNRVGAYWQNQGATQLQVILDHDLTGANFTVILADPGGAANTQGGDGSFAQMGIRHTGQIRIACANGNQFAAGEW